MPPGCRPKTRPLRSTPAVCRVRGQPTANRGVGGQQTPPVLNQVGQGQSTQTRADPGAGKLGGQPSPWHKLNEGRNQNPSTSPPPPRKGVQSEHHLANLPVSRGASNAVLPGLPAEHRCEARPPRRSCCLKAVFLLTSFLTTGGRSERLLRGKETILRLHSEEKKVCDGQDFPVFSNALKSLSVHRLDSCRGQARCAPHHRLTGRQPSIFGHARSGAFTISSHYVQLHMSTLF